MNDYKEDFRVEHGVLFVRLSGIFPNELLRGEENLFQPLVTACLANNCKKALVDARGLQLDFGTMAMFRAGEDAAFLSRLGLRVALLAREDMLDPFFGNVAANRGGDLGIFTDMEAARHWIEGEV